nr:DUF4158 domain-containing protein [Streptomyces rimosus]
MVSRHSIGRFPPDDPLDAPWPVVEHLAAQLGIEDAPVAKRYTERPKTAYEHAWKVRNAYEFREYEDAEWSRRFRSRSDQSVTGRHSASRATMSLQARCACRGW